NFFVRRVLWHLNDLVEVGRARRRNLVVLIFDSDTHFATADVRWCRSVGGHKLLRRHVSTSRKHTIFDSYALLIRHMHIPKQRAVEFFYAKSQESVNPTFWNVEYDLAIFNGCRHVDSGTASSTQDDCDER